MLGGEPAQLSLGSKDCPETRIRSPGVSEMARVVCPDGIVTAYSWDITGGGFPYEALQAEMRGLGVAVPMPPSPGASRLDAMQALWTGAGLNAVEQTSTHYL
jgi:hypothetical protein